MKSVPYHIDWVESKPERNHGRGFKNNDVKRGYVSEPMYDFPDDSKAVRRRRMRKEDEERYDNGCD